uniref:SH2 domain-containing protein n=2 Tax=Macrostomum lignano TaxID=282301 RepID=A0A1I8G3B9_9PLAT
TSSVDGGETPPPLPPKPNSLTSSSLMWQKSQPADWDLAESLAAGRPGDPLCSYLCAGYYRLSDVRLGKELMKQAQDDGVYMLRGFCHRQSGMERELCVRYDKNEKVAVFRIRLTPKGYQVSNGHNERLHVSMEALLFHHHIFHIQVAAPQQQEVLLRRPYDLEPRPDNRKLTDLLRTSLWHHGTKEFCAEVLKASPEEGTYALRMDTEGQSVAVLCVKQNHQILKLRISADQDGKQYGFQNDDKTQEGDNSLVRSRKFASLEELVVYYHRHLICDSQLLILSIPFQLVP